MKSGSMGDRVLGWLGARGPQFAASPLTAEAHQKGLGRNCARLPVLVRDVDAVLGEKLLHLNVLRIHCPLRRDQKSINHRSSHSGSAQYSGFTAGGDPGRPRTAWLVVRRCWSERATRRHLDFVSARIMRGLEQPHYILTSGIPIASVQRDQHVFLSTQGMQRVYGGGARTGLLACRCIRLGCWLRAYSELMNQARMSAVSAIGDVVALAAPACGGHAAGSCPTDVRI
jgi:hypothetical protein